MRAQFTSVLDVLDNFATASAERIDRLRGKDLQVLGERIREFSASHQPAIDTARAPTYLGGWPSANIGFVGGDLLLSSLLYSGQVVVRDPIADWFSAEQYRNEHLLVSTPGYLNWGAGAWEERNAQTRRFLRAVIPALERFRPLIEAGIVVPVPFERPVLERAAQIDALRRSLADRLLGDVDAYTDRFGPDEIATEHTARGMFVFPTGPDQMTRRREVLGHGLRYFAREYVVASAAGATYAAPFRHELYLCHDGVNAVVGPAGRVTNALLRSEIPVFSGLSPALIRDLHDDDAFAEFRSELHQIYSRYPIEASEAERATYVSDQEQALLEPTLARARRSARAGLVGRLGVALKRGSFGIMTGLAVDTALHTGGMATALGVAKAAIDELPGALRVPGTQRIWTALVRHDRVVRDEMRASQIAASSNSAGGWAVSLEPSLSVVVTAGTVLQPLDTTPDSDGGSPDRGYFGGVYRLCGCGSGQKYRFCCDGLGAAPSVPAA